MEKPRSPVREDLKEIAWAVFMIDLMLVLAGLFVSARTDSPDALWSFLGITAVVTVMFAVMVLGNWLLVAIVRRARRLFDDPGDGPRAETPRRGGPS